MKKKWLTLVFGSALFLAACGGGDDDKKDSTAGDTTGDKAGETAAQSEGEKIVMTSCISCHGGELQGMGNFPALNNVGSRLSEAEILDVIQHGRNAMPAGLIQGEQAEQAAAWLATQK